MPTRTLEHRVTAVQEAFIADPAPRVLFRGGIGSGKTTAGALRVLETWQQRQGPQLGMVVAPTYTMLRDAVWRTCLAYWAPVLTHVSHGHLQVQFVDGSEVLFRSADQPDRLRGPNLHWAWLDEAGQLPDRTVYDVLLGRLRADPQHGGRLWLTTTPRGYNWLYQLEQAGQVAVHVARSQDNPFLPAGYVADLRALYPLQFARQELEAEYVSLGVGLIQRAWLPVVPAAPPGLRWARYWDLATSTRTHADATASVRAALADGVCYLADLVHGRWPWPETRRRILAQCAAEAADTPVVGVESTAFQLAAVQDLQADARSWQVALRPVPATRDKLSRALPWVARAEQGHVRLVAGSPWERLWDECEQFPAGPHDDCVDAVSGAVALAQQAAPGAVAVRVQRQPPRWGAAPAAPTLPWERP